MESTKPKLILQKGGATNIVPTNQADVKSTSITGYIYQQASAITGFVLKQAAILENIPTFYKLLFLVCFYVFFYKIFYDIGIFFGLNTVELVLYMTWFGILILFLAFLKTNRSKLL